MLVNNRSLSTPFHSLTAVVAVVEKKLEKARKGYLEDKNKSIRAAGAMNGLVNTTFLRYLEKIANRGVQISKP